MSEQERAASQMKTESTQGDKANPARTTPTAAELDVRVGSRIRARREALRITQNRLAAQLGVTFSQIQKYEKGSNRIGAGRLYIVASYLGVPIEYFFEGSPTPQGATASGRAMSANSELTLLKEAFVSITDAETRGSVLALVRSLAASADLANKPRQAIA
jgi:transcriptional regulator with XRE-family HTH domain